jgi:hypothetical protein
MNINIDLSKFDNIKLEEKSNFMKTGKSKSWLGEYHWVKIENTEDKQLDIEKAKKWCNKNFGSSASVWYEHKSVFFFKEEKNLTMFILKWS